MDKLPNIAFFSNDVSNYMTPEFEKRVKSEMNEKVNTGSIKSSLPISITYNEETDILTFENIEMEEKVANNSRVEPGVIKLPEIYTDTTKLSLADDPIYKKHLESSWGF